MDLVLCWCRITILKIIWGMMDIKEDMQVADINLKLWEKNTPLGLIMGNRNILIDEISLQLGW